MFLEYCDNLNSLYLKASEMTVSVKIAPISSLAGVIIQVQVHPWQDYYLEHADTGRWLTCHNNRKLSSCSNWRTLDKRRNVLKSSYQLTSAICCDLGFPAKAGSSFRVLLQHWCPPIDDACRTDKHPWKHSSPTKSISTSFIFIGFFLERVLLYRSV